MMVMRRGTRKRQQQRIKAARRYVCTSSEDEHSECGTTHTTQLARLAKSNSIASIDNPADACRNTNKKQQYRTTMYCCKLNMICKDPGGVERYARPCEATKFSKFYSGTGSSEVQLSGKLSTSRTYFLDLAVNLYCCWCDGRSTLF